MQKFESTLRLSKFFIAIQGTLLIGSLISVSGLSIPFFLKMTGILIVFGYGFWVFYANRQWRAIGQDVQGWYLNKAGKILRIEPLGESTITPFVSILRFKQDRFKQDKKILKQSCLIFKDSMFADSYRSFIVRMRYFKKNRENYPEIR